MTETRTPMLVRFETDHGEAVWINPNRVVMAGPAGDATTWLRLAGLPGEMPYVRGTVAQVAATLAGK